MRCGVEFEYLLIDTAGPQAGRIRNFANLPFAEISELLAEKPGRDEPGLATGDLGIKSGYWYVEGDERFHADGRFRTLAVKGVEIRTPPAGSVPEALGRLLAIERQLSALLAKHDLGLAIAGFHPLIAAYPFDPPLNAWEVELRSRNRAYDGSHISTLSYGPDINLSMPEWSTVQCLDVARKLNCYAPWIIPFSFSSPFFAGDVWPGCSKRTFERAPLRPAVKLFLAAPELAALGNISRLIHPVRLPGEAGRIEFKAFDAMPSLETLRACCHLLEGICLANDLPGRSEEVDLARYRRGALVGFTDAAVRAVASDILRKARSALLKSGDVAAAGSLIALETMLVEQRTPADDLLDAYRQNGLMLKPGGLA
ncbi:glutamate--cysteine ligase family protein [Rhodocyclus tenuis]|uniref:Gamma-glutamyl:cysteine ligase YbdK (ATP-grasp superfamily) n=1 Tax=Rhodocyclus tenuis TaxID=1066 RepID=A0A840G7Q8_RHOTE|nr:glutamate-cysteine ligase family protein [Rhodocyclus tenuis]MBB4247906.1 gamma-glutamyl:cysteine ligase YbdK (ATP-grasp superfamily) [Rhodocyclus tenuis]